MHNPLQLIRVITNERNPILLYDADLFQSDMTVSISMLFGDDVPGVTHYNTIHNPLDVYAQGAVVHSAPKATPILGMKFPSTPLTTRYFISADYDSANEYLYTWSIVGDSGSLLSSADKQAMVHFQIEGNSLLQCVITNNFGGTRTIQLLINAGQQPKKIMVVRNAAVKATDL